MDLIVTFTEICGVRQMQLWNCPLLCEIIRENNFLILLVSADNNAFKAAQWSSGKIPGFVLKVPGSNPFLN